MRRMVARAGKPLTGKGKPDRTGQNESGPASLRSRFVCVRMDEKRFSASLNRTFN